MTTDIPYGCLVEYHVAAVNIAGAGDVPEFTVNLSVPDKAITPSTTTRDSSIDLSWSAPSTYALPISNYLVQYSVGTTNTWITFDHPVSTSRTISVSGLTNGTG